MTINFTKDPKVQRLISMNPFYLVHTNGVDILAFRRILERALKYGFWNGTMAEVS